MRLYDLPLLSAYAHCARPSAHELLLDPFIKKGFKAEKLFDVLLHDISEVGAGAAAASSEDLRPGEGKCDIMSAFKSAYSPLC